MQVLTGDDVMIGGFVIGGSANKTVAVVATGPSLSAFGIANPLANPTLTLVRSSDQAVIATNDNWQAAGNALQLQAAGFAPSNALESAILINLAPGAYTEQHYVNVRWTFAECNNSEGCGFDLQWVEGGL